VVAGIGEPEASLNFDTLTQLDAEGHILDGRLRPPRGPVVRWVRPQGGPPPARPATAPPVGRFIVTFGQGRWVPPVVRLALATVAHALATATGPAVNHEQ
jgi:hypothetical protein